MTFYIKRNKFFDVFWTVIIFMSCAIAAYLFVTGLVLIVIVCTDFWVTIL